MIYSLQHPYVQHLVKLKKSRAYRQESQSLLLEGKNCIADVTKKHKAKCILLGPDMSLPDGCQAEEVIEVTRPIIEKISAVQTPDNIIAEMPMPAMKTVDRQNYLLVCDGIQEPGNLGTLMRTALALGWEGLFLIEPCADPFNDKALRAAKGATFEMPMQRGSWLDFEMLVKEHGFTVCVADLEGEAPTEITPKLALVLGNESQGVRVPPGFPHRKVTIPMKGSMESLNVAAAGAILMYVLKV